MEKKEAMKILKDFYDKSALFSIRTALDTVIPELKELENDNIKEGLIQYFNKFNFNTFAGLDPKKILAWLEKQGEQKSVDKTEPKFKVGDWVVINGFTVLITDVRNDLYDAIFVNGECRIYDTNVIDKDAHLWTIQDAKDGDVLQLGEVTAIFKEFIGNGNCICYCSVCIDLFEIPSQDESYGCHNATPATKEQRDTLMKAMTDVGYTFNFEKKELKEIEHKHFCELDNSYTCVKFPFKAKVKSSGKIVTIHGGQIGPDGKEWIKYQSDGEDGYKVYEPNDLELVCEIEENSAWSEEDEKMLNRLIEHLKYASAYGKPETCRNGRLTDWLKSLKDRYTWKPSEEQMRALELTLKYSQVSHYLNSLFNDLKKLM